jgi:hypothetical protein
LEATIHKCGEIIKSRFMDMGDLINTDACLNRDRKTLAREASICCTFLFGNLFNLFPLPTDGCMHLNLDR